MTSTAILSAFHIFRGAAFRCSIFHLTATSSQTHSADHGHVFIGSNLMQELTKQPHIFEQMLLSDFFLPLTEHDDFHQTLSARLEQKDTEVQLDEVRRFAREAKFRAAAHIVTYPETVIEAAGYLSDLADACLAHSLAITYEAFITKHGIIADSHFAIVLLGRAGKGQLTPQSDIDAIFIYDGDTEAEV